MPRAIMDDMSDDKQRQEGAISPELSRHAATGDDSDYSLSIEEALARYEAAGLPRTTRRRFVESESTFAYFHAVRAYLGPWGKPVAFYSDTSTASSGSTIRGRSAATG